jgi:CheY-like chemotaxis protein
MDIQLPELNGYEATKRIKTFNKELPIIAQAANVMEGDMKKAFDVGCSDYISKPIDIDQLLKILRKYLN